MSKVRLLYAAVLEVSITTTDRKMLALTAADMTFVL